MRHTWLAVFTAMACLSPLLLLGSAAAQQKKDDKKPPLGKLVITPGQGEQKKPISVTLKADEGTVIRYTLDGTTPSGPDSGLAYSAPIEVSKTTTIVAAGFKNGEPATQPANATYLFNPRQGLSTFHIGNSLTNTTGQFANLAKTAGINHKYQSFTAGGALTKKLWDVDMVKRKDAWDKMLANTPKIDIFTVQPRDFNIEQEADTDIKFFELIRKHSPDFQPWLYCEWVEKGRGRPTDKGKVPSSQMKTLYPALTWEESMAAMLLYVEELQLKIGETYKKGKKPRVLPSSLAMGWVNNLIEKGKFGGAPAGSFYPLLFSDGVHPNANGAFLVDCTWYAAFYRESPEGKFLPVGTKLTPEQAAIMQRLAWDVVKNYPDCGLYEDGTTPAGTPVVTPAASAIGEVTPVTLSSPTPGAWFRYTLDGTTPTRTRGYVYCGVISVRPGMTVKAVAYKSGMADSTVAEATFGKK